MRTAAVILNYGDSADTLACVASLERSRDLGLDLFVVDNGPDDERHRQLRSALGVGVHVVATGENLGYAGGNNVGIKLAFAADAELIWILNPDTRVGPDTLGALKKHMATVPDCAIVGSRILYGGEDRRIWFDGATIDASTSATSHLHNGRIAETVIGPSRLDVGYVTGAAPLIRRAALEQVGFLPEHYFLYFEETHWCVRARESGWRVMVDRTAEMTHMKRSSGSLPTSYYLYYMTRNRYGFARDALGIDPAVAMAHHRTTFLEPWRAKVSAGAPAWLDSFDDIVERALRDAQDGRFGRNDAITDYPGPQPPTPA